MIVLFLGTMFAGKSRELIKIYREHNWRRRTCLVPSLPGSRQDGVIDGRDPAQRIVARVVEDEMKAELPEEGDLFIDEAQFFSPVFAFRLAEHQAKNPDLDIYVAALSLDSNAAPWPTSGTLACLADQIVRLHSNCAICGQDAIYSALVKRAEPFRDSTFEPRCRNCFFTKPKE